MAKIRDKCDHLWVSGGLVSDWICERGSERRNLDDYEEKT